jgi:DnaK suppressor protein
MKRQEFQAMQKRKKTTTKTTTRKIETKPSQGHKIEAPLTAEEIEHYKSLLLDKRREIMNSVSEMEDETLKKSRMDSSGDLSSMPIHMADLGSDNFEQEFALELVDSERKLLTEIDDALTRIEEGTYGICQGLNTQIPRSRLEAQPWASYSREYAEMLEKGQEPKEE